MKLLRPIKVSGVTWLSRNYTMHISLELFSTVENDDHDLANGAFGATF